MPTHKLSIYYPLTLLHTFLSVPGYGAITNIHKIGPGHPHTLDSLTQIDYYIDYMITALQGGPKEQR